MFGGLIEPKWLRLSLSLSLAPSLSLSLSMTQSLSLSLVVALFPLCSLLLLSPLSDSLFPFVSSSDRKESVDPRRTCMGQRIHVGMHCLARNHIYTCRSCNRAASVWSVIGNPMPSLNISMARERTWSGRICLWERSIGPGGLHTCYFYVKTSGNPRVQLIVYNIAWQRNSRALVGRLAKRPEERVSMCFMAHIHLGRLARRLKELMKFAKRGRGNQRTCRCLILFGGPAARVCLRAATCLCK